MREAKTRVITIRTTNQELFEALWFFNHRNLNPGTISSLGAMCVSLVAELGRSLGSPEPPEWLPKDSFTKQRFSQEDLQRAADMTRGR